MVYIQYLLYIEEYDQNMRCIVHINLTKKFVVQNLETDEVLCKISNNLFTRPLVLNLFPFSPSSAQRVGMCCNIKDCATLPFLYHTVCNASIRVQRFLLPPLREAPRVEKRFT